MEPVEVVEVARLHEEVRLLAKRLPQLLHHALEVDELIGFDKARCMAHDRAHDVDVLCHNLLGSGALHLDGDVLAGHERGAMHLGERGATQGLAVDMEKISLSGLPYSATRHSFTTQTEPARHWSAGGAAHRNTPAARSPNDSPGSGPS